MTLDKLSISESLNYIEKRTDCCVRAGKPKASLFSPAGYVVPADLTSFYELCDGVELFVDTGFSYRIVTSFECQPINPILIGERAGYDITASWHVVSRHTQPDSQY